MAKKDIIVQKPRSSGRPGGSHMAEKEECQDSSAKPFLKGTEDLREKQCFDALVL